MYTPNIRTSRKVVNALRDFGQTLGDWVKWEKTKSKLRAAHANKFLLGVMLDQNILASRAWASAEWIVDSFDNSDDPASLWEHLAKIDKRRLTGFLRYGCGGNSFHRHYKTFARLLPLAAQIILDKYDGDPRKIWNNQRDIDIVRSRLEEIPTIGPALSRMAVLILARDHGLLGGLTARKNLDVKPDIHVKRVFQRTGLTAKGATDMEVVKVARELSPKFPGSLDAPCWEIGSKWCRPARPNCKQCPIGEVCQKLLRS